MFLDNPHLVTSFFGKIVKTLNENQSQIFNDDHALIPYYTSAFAYYKLEMHFRKGNIESKYKKIRFHILMVFKILNSKEAMPPFNSQRKMESYCKPLLEILNDDDKSLQAFGDCVEVLNSTNGFDISDKQDIKLLSKTRSIIDSAESYKKIAMLLYST